MGDREATAAVTAALTPTVCTGKADGFYCDGDHLATCAGGVLTNSVACSTGCLAGSRLGDDKCAGDYCDGVANGSYCVSEEETVYVCSGGRTNDKKACPLGCAPNTPTGHDACRDCGPGKLLCNNGCVPSDIQNCGACGNVCLGGPQGAAACPLGRCGLTCSVGFADCDGDLSNGCEAGLDGTANCGRCGNRCMPGQNAGPVCANGTCGLTCTVGFADCNHSATDGCEVALATDARNCGACGVTCPATQVCAAGRCASATAECMSDGDCFVHADVCDGRCACEALRVTTKVGECKIFSDCARDPCFGIAGASCQAGRCTLVQGGPSDMFSTPSTPHR